MFLKKILQRFLAPHISNDNQKSFVLGNIKDNTIFSIFTNSKIVNLRKHLSLQGKKRPLCDSCNFGF